MRALFPWSSAEQVRAVCGWGRRPSTVRALAYAKKHELPYVALEDGFLRSFAAGDRFPPLSLVVDDAGIYYDCTGPSGLERLIASDADLLLPSAGEVEAAITQLLDASLSKYNHARALEPHMLRSDDVERVLVIDQTMGDMSVVLGGGDAATFQVMLEAALHENPRATIYVKTHPEVSSGRKRGYLTHVQEEGRVVVLRDAVNPLSLIRSMDRVYVVTSTMGFEALLLGKPVSCFGVPWYAGWGITVDRQRMHPALKRRSRAGLPARSVTEVFAAAYLHYTRYLDPETQQLGNIFDVMAWLERQRAMAQRFAGRMICTGFPLWRASNFRGMLSLHVGGMVHVRDTSAALALTLRETDCLVCWGREAPPGAEALAAEHGIRLLRMEDGFVRSVGLGSDLISPRSFVLDTKGIYFDPSRPSELEDILNQRVFTARDTERAARVRATMVDHGITKYNLEVVQPVDWGMASGGRQLVLVPGQVEDDASIQFGCDHVNGVHTNIGLLQAARERFPNAFIVFKPHPDVETRNRIGKVAATQALRWADFVETQASVVSCIQACDVVVTMTSLTGFDALLQGKKVVVHGRPFYAGWGLTLDVLAVPRRQRTLTLDELVAGTLLHYPLYWDPVLKGYTTCEAVLLRIIEERAALERSGGLARLRDGYLRRKLRKAGALLRAVSLAWAR